MGRLWPWVTAFLLLFAGFLVGFWFTVLLLGGFIDWVRISSKAVYLFQNVGREETASRPVYTARIKH